MTLSLQKIWVLRVLNIAWPVSPFLGHHALFPTTNGILQPHPLHSARLFAKHDCTFFCFLKMSGGGSSSSGRSMESRTGRDKQRESPAFTGPRVAEACPLPSRGLTQVFQATTPKTSDRLLVWFP